MKRLLLILLTIAGLNQSIQAQYHQLLHKTYAERRPLLRDFYTSEMLDFKRNMWQIQRKVNDITRVAKENEDVDLEYEAGLMQLHINLSFVRNDKKQIPKILFQIDSLHQIAIEKQVWWFAARLESFGHLTCFETEYNYELAFNYLQQLNQTLDKINQEEFPEKQVCYLQTGSAYYHFQDYESALRFWKRGLMEKPREFEDQVHVQLNNNIGVAFQKIYQIDSSTKYFDQALKFLTFKKETDSIWFGVLKGNIAENLYTQGAYDQAMKLFQVVIKAGIKYNNLGVVANGYTYLGAIYLEKGDWGRSAESLQMARTYISISENNEFVRLEKLFPLFSKLYKQKGDYKLSSCYLDSALLITDSLKSKINTLQILRGHEKAELLKQRIFQDERKLKTMQRNFLIAFVFILTTIAIYIFIQQRKKHQHQQRIKDLELRHKERELLLAKNQLEYFSVAISEKQQLVDELMDKMGTSANTEAILKLQQSTILTDEEWEHFKRLFEQVHGGYLVRLREKLPDLSPAETRFMVLAKLKFSNKEMAATLGITQQAVRTTWYRLRKRLQLPEEGSPEELVSKI